MNDYRALKLLNTDYKIYAGGTTRSLSMILGDVTTKPILLHKGKHDYRCCCRNPRCRGLCRADATPNMSFDSRFPDGI